MSKTYRLPASQLTTAKADGHVLLADLPETRNACRYSLYKYSEGDALLAKRK